MTSDKSDLHVVFGTGPLGLAVMRELVRRGKSVRLVNSRGIADAPPEVEVCQGNAYAVASTRELTRGAAVVYQCAMPPYHEWPQKFPALQASILEGTAANGAKLVLGDNLYMYGSVAGTIREDLPYRAHTRKGRLRAELAQSALAAHQAGKVRVTIGRGSTFFGPAVLNSTLGERAIRPALAGKAAQLIGDLDTPHTHTFIDDFGRALVILGERDEALGQAWHVPNDRPAITQRELMTLFFEEIGKPPKLKAMGRRMLTFAGLFVPAARETVEMLYEFEQPFVVDSGKFERAFDMKATPLRSAIRATVNWYREHTPAQQRRAAPVAVANRP